MASGPTSSLNVDLSQWMYTCTFIYLPTYISRWDLGTAQAYIYFFIWPCIPSSVPQRKIMLHKTSL